MIRLIENKDIQEIKELHEKNNINISTEYLESLIGNMTEYIYVSCNETKITGLMTCCSTDNIYIKNILTQDNNKEQITAFIKHLIFNANKDIVIELNKTETEMISILKDFGFTINDTKDNKIVLKKEFTKIVANNIEIINYYEQPEDFKRTLLEQINEPLWPGAKHLYDRINNQQDDGKLFIMYDTERNHIISFATLHDFDEIENDNMKPWIGSVYTFRVYRGNRYSELLIKYILKEASLQGYENVYLSSDNQGMYEKFGFELHGIMETVKGNKTQVFVYDTKKLESENTKRR